MKNPDIRPEAGGIFSVASETAPGIRYAIDLSIPTCNCPASQYRPAQPCKHIEAVRAHTAVAIQLHKEPEKGERMETPEQKQLFAILLNGADRLAAIAPKAQACGCAVLAEYLKIVQGQMKEAVAAQRRQLNGAAEPFVVV